MLATNAPDPNCAYDWMAYMSTPKIQAEDAISYGETPANTLACPIMNQLQKGGCAAYHANAPLSYFKTIKFWKTPLPTCDNGQNELRGLHPVATGLDGNNRPNAACRLAQ